MIKRSIRDTQLQLERRLHTSQAIDRGLRDELEDMASYRLRALINIEANKARVARWYDKKVKIKEFIQGELLWKLILPIGTKHQRYGKWSPTWEGPYRISRFVPGNAYILETLEGEK